jgi:pyruvate dehydrogenase E2 component (dihydrolipoamide acetyltransferase)
MPFEIRVPSSGELGDDVTLVEWRKKPGEEINRGDVIAEVEADKGILEIEAVVDGVLESTIEEKGADLEPGSLIGIIRTEDDEDGPPAAEIPETEQESGRSAAVVPKAAPAARSMARKNGIGIEELRGSGPGGVVTVSDIQAYLDKLGADKLTSAAVHSPPLSANRKAVIRKVSESRDSIPAVRFGSRIVMERALQVKKEGDLIWDALLIKTAAAAVEAVPVFRDAFEGSTEKPQINRNEKVSIAFALGRGDTLYTPVIFDAAQLSLQDIDRQIRSHISKAETGNFSKNDFSGGCMLVSNLGMYGIDWFEAMVYPGQSAALSTGTIREEALVRSGGIHIVSVMEAVLAVDHRIINGIQAAEFLREFKRYMEEEL